MYDLPESELLRLLADRAGIAADYYDIAGSLHVPTDETRRAILAAMKLRVDNRAELIDELTAWDNRSWIQHCEPVRAVRSGEPPGIWSLNVPCESLEDSVVRVRWWLVSETKDLTAIVAAHNIPYVAQASPHNWLDFMKKVKKALAVKGPSFINVISTCHRGWRSKPAEAVSILRKAVDSCYWPLFEIENGKLTITYKPKTKVPVTDWLKLQGRFAHLFKPAPNEAMLAAFQERVDFEWERLRKQESCGL